MISVNIFTPVYHRYVATKNSLESVIKCINSSVYSCKLLIGVNGVENDEMKEWLKSLANNKIKVYFSEKNVGKAEIINYMYSKHNDCTHVISIDSDMIADEEGNFIDNMIWAIEHFPVFGLLSSFQKEANCHIWNDMGGLPKTCGKGNCVIKYGNHRCVAGGCVILKKETWQSIQGYNTYGKVYGFDDAIMMSSVIASGKDVGVLESTKLTHPFDTDKGYSKWKSENISKRKESGYYD